MKWFKFYGADFLTDPKVFALTPSERGVFITLLSLTSMAGSSDGVIEHLTAERLAVAAGADPTNEEWERSVKVLEKLERLEIVRLDSNGKVTVLNWRKRQEIYMSNAERQRRFREKKKSNTKVTPKRNKSNARSRSRSRSRIEEITPAASRLAMKKNRMGSYREDSAQDSHEEAIDIETGERINPKQRKSSKHSLEIYALFGEYPKNWLWNASQRKAADALYERGIEKVKQALGFYRQHRDDEFCPRILTPFDLDSKWIKLSDYKRKNSL